MTFTFAAALARSMAAAFLANERSSMTAPMKFEKSVTSPWGRPLVMSTRSSRMTFQREAGT